MSRNLWMFSDKLDDEDIEIMKHCRNYHYACPGMLTGTPCFFRSGYEIRGPCTQVENHEYNSKEILL